MTREQYLLACLAEECAEIAHRASKAIRFGLHPHPGRPAEWRGVSNREAVEAELGDLLGVCDMLGLTPSQHHRDRKPEKVEHYMLLSEKLGTLKT